MCMYIYIYVYVCVYMCIYMYISHAGVGMWIAGLSFIAVPSFIAVQYIGEGGGVCYFLLRVCHLLFGNS